ncbi:Spore maturation protein B [Moorella humiferrea]|uniref:Spore maturation protein B n=1 Tax=Neomoorella humiferrea TaxID=676965 RepID=A0A2T0AVY8_9FIRM|nr:spore maturation protein [Moorella humiferrea]PRR74707.1 Spore maturation protein B [Moorella humiferrea]
MTEIILEVSRWAIPLVLFFIPLYGYLRGVPIYETFVAGAEDGFKVAIKIIPFLVGMLVAIAIFRASGAMDLLARSLNPLLRLIGVPGEVLPLAIMRPLSGGGALGIAAELISNYGPDSFIGRLASVMQGSTDTTFYVLTVYFGSVGVRRYRYALALGLLADISSLVAAIVICRLMFA